MEDLGRLRTGACADYIEEVCDTVALEEVEFFVEAEMPAV